jgi:hypothetical protein
MTDIFIGGPLGGGLRRLTDTKETVEEAPCWGPSGPRLSYTAWRPFGTPPKTAPKPKRRPSGFGKGIWEMNADGTCPTEILGGRASLYDAAVWQPGVGREAGPISC